MRYIIIVSMCLGFLSCKKFLEEKPLGNSPSSNLLSSKIEVMSVVNGLYRGGFYVIYDPLNASQPFDGTPVMSGMFKTGYFDNEDYRERDHIKSTRELSQTSNSMEILSTAIWKEIYRAIYISNTLLAIKDISFLGDDAKRIMSEARFFRAINYFYLVKNFGNVPLILHAETDFNNIVKRRISPVDSVYGSIIADLSKVLEDAVLSDNKTFAQSDYRISLPVVRTLLSDVYLNFASIRNNDQDLFKKSFDLAKNVIDSKIYALETNDVGANSDVTLSAYDKLRTKQYTDEYIYVKEYDATLAQSPYFKYTVPYGASGKTKTQGPNGSYIITKKFLNAYEEGDLRRKEKQFFCDSLEDLVNNEEVKIDFRGNTFPYLWYDKNALFFNGTSSKSFPIYSYSHLLLIAAEAAVMNSNPSIDLAKDYVVEVRYRAFPKKTKTDLKNALPSDVSGLCSEIWKEKIRELPLQFKLWEDIVRTRKFPVISSITKGDVTFSDLLGSKNAFDFRFEEADLYIPIGISVLQANEVLK